MTSALQKTDRETYRLTYRPRPRLRFPAWALEIWKWL